MLKRVILALGSQWEVVLMLQTETHYKKGPILAS